MVKILDVNQATLQLFNARRKEEIKDLSRNINEEFLEDFRKELLAIALGKTKYESGVEVRKSSGEVRYSILNWSAMPGFERDFSRVLVSIIDISELKRAEDTLRESEARYHALVNESADGVLLTIG